MVEHTLVDGSRLTVDGPASFNLSGVPISHGVWRVGGRLQLFASGPLGNARSFVSGLGVAQFDEVFSIGGGTLSLGSDSLGRLAPGVAGTRRWGVWEGAQFSIWTHVTGGIGTDHQMSSLLVDLFTSFAIEEIPSGVAMRALGEATVEREHPLNMAHKDLPGIGAFDVGPLDSYRARWIPPWAGTPTAAGDIYLHEERGSDHHDGGVIRTLLIVNDTAVARLAGGEHLDQATLVDAAASIVLSWQSANAHAAHE